MRHNLRGKINNVRPLTLDKTLSVEGSSADAKAVGDAIKAAEDRLSESLKTHKENYGNPHKVTAQQVGLGKVDNTSDAEKPVSTKQAEAISAAENNAKSHANSVAGTAENNAKSHANSVASTAENNAKAHADSVAGNAENNSKEYAKQYSDSKHLPASVTLLAAGWSANAPFTQTVEVEGILEDDRPHWGLVRSGDAAAKLAQKEAYALVDELETANGSVTFTCDEEKPEVDLTIQLEVNR